MKKNFRKSKRARINAYFIFCKKIESIFGLIGHSLCNEISKFDTLKSISLRIRQKNSSWYTCHYN